MSHRTVDPLRGNPDHFTCDCCGETFRKCRSDEEALAECAALFGAAPDLEDQAVVCSVCNAAFMAWARTQPGPLKRTDLRCGGGT